jgi:MazG family protein
MTISENISTLIDIVKRLRAPNGCPWDREQTFQSLTPHIIEEAYELVDAIEKESFSDIKEELGDVLLHVVMLSELAAEKNEFSISDVARQVAEKMIRRHPHVFADTKVDSVADVWKNWDAIKKQEKNQNNLIDAIPKNLPALMQAALIQKRVSRIGFDWADIQGPIDKIYEELNEVQQQIKENKNDKKRIEE